MCDKDQTAPVSNDDAIVVPVENENKVRLTEDHLAEMLYLQSNTALDWFKKGQQLVANACESRLNSNKSQFNATQALSIAITSSCVSQICNYPADKANNPKRDAQHAKDLEGLKRWLHSSNLVKMEANNLCKAILNSILDHCVQNGGTAMTIPLVNHRCAGKRLLFSLVYEEVVQKLRSLNYDARLETNYDKQKAKYDTILVVNWESPKLYSRNSATKWYYDTTQKNQERLRDSFGPTIPVVAEEQEDTTHIEDKKEHVDQ